MEYPKEKQQIINISNDISWRIMQALKYEKGDSIASNSASFNAQRKTVGYALYDIDKDLNSDNMFLFIREEIVTTFYIFLYFTLITHNPKFIEPVFDRLVLTPFREYYALKKMSSSTSTKTFYGAIYPLMSIYGYLALLNIYAYNSQSHINKDYLKKVTDHVAKYISQHYKNWLIAMRRGGAGNSMAKKNTEENFLEFAVYPVDFIYDNVEHNPDKQSEMMDFHRRLVNTLNTKMSENTIKDTIKMSVQNNIFNKFNY